MKVLIIDDDLGIRGTLGVAIETLGHEVSMVANRAGAEKKLRSESFEAAFLDLRLGADSGLDLLPDLLRLSPRLAVIVITAYSSIETAVAAIQRGAFDYLAKPFKPQQIAQILERVAKARQMEARLSDLEGRLIKPGSNVELEETADPAMRALLEIARKSADSSASILITGESGTGKSVLARQIHHWSARAREPFVTVSCPSLSRELFESELFGHVKGAFTGAITSTWGKVAAADRGTLFLDEVGELPLEIQPKLLRLLQEHEYERVGDAKIYRADVRIIAATNRDLRKDVTAGRFREDLLYRLDVMTLRMPSLRERAADILPLAGWHLHLVARQAAKPITGISPEARALLQRYAWPGNIRELRNMMERAMILAGEGEIQPAHLPAVLSEPAGNRPFLGGDYSLEEVEAEHIRQILARQQSLQDAAALLKVDRKTLLRRRKELNLE
ncbi:MAG: sigma-54 dependent transcriptional regulator [Verrucomicrobiota bacterium]